MSKSAVSSPSIGYIVVDYKPRQHADFAAAATERDRLKTAHPEKEFRVIKIVNASHSEIENYNRMRALLCDEEPKTPGIYWREAAGVVPFCQKCDMQTFPIVSFHPVDSGIQDYKCPCCHEFYSVSYKAKS